MTKIISFKATSAFASFRDPSVTSNQVVYYVPSKTALVGMLGAMIGIQRSNLLEKIYEQEYLDFFSKLSIGVKLENNPKKITYFTNHRSLKASKTKPVKKEILETPKYEFFVKAPEDILDKLENTIKESKYEFIPYFGHAYCPAKISDFAKHEATLLNDVKDEQTDCVVLDECDSSFNENFNVKLECDYDATLVVERHLHHFFLKDKFESRVLKYWIPISSALCDIEQLQENTISEFYKINSKVYCLY